MLLVIIRHHADPRRLSENGYFSQSLRQAQILILEILPCIPVVKIIAFLDLEKTISFSDSLLDEITINWQARRDSNPQHPDLESGALAVRATGLHFVKTYFVSL